MATMLEEEELFPTLPLVWLVFKNINLKLGFPSFSV
jgi:hypothetical protein